MTSVDTLLLVCRRSGSLKGLTWRKGVSYHTCTFVQAILHTSLVLAADKLILPSAKISNLPGFWLPTTNEHASVGPLHNKNTRHEGLISTNCVFIYNSLLLTGISF